MGIRFDDQTKRALRALDEDFVIDGDGRHSHGRDGAQDCSPCR
jgi:hypothetical protein